MRQIMVVLAAFVLAAPAYAQSPQSLEPMSAGSIGQGQFGLALGDGSYPEAPAKVPVRLSPDELAALHDNLAKVCPRLPGKTDEFKCPKLFNYSGCEALLLEGTVFDCQGDRWDRNPMFYDVIDVAATDANSKVEILSAMSLEVKKGERGGGVARGQMGYTFITTPPVLAPKPVSECDPTAAARYNTSCERPCIGMNPVVMAMTGSTGGTTRIGQTVVCAGQVRSQLNLDEHENVRAWDRCERAQAGGVLFQFPDSKVVSRGPNSVAMQREKYLMHRYVREIRLPVKVSCIT
jgi:hypothetical protein